MDSTFNGTSSSVISSLPRSFFERPTLEVAYELVGMRLNFHSNSGIITETEAYIGRDDPACHAARGITPRTKVMFGPAGFSYIYFIYGMYHCLNIVTEPREVPAAILIRGVWWEQTNTYLNGPGKLCKAWAITKEHNSIDICISPYFNITLGTQPKKILTTPRIGIKVGTDLLWRFLMSDEDLHDIKKASAIGHPKDH